MTHPQDAYFYPEVRKALGEGGVLVDESPHEHQVVKEALAALEDLDRADAAYDPQVAALIADVCHHVEEEEGEMFPTPRAASAPCSSTTLGTGWPTVRPRPAPTRTRPRRPAARAPRWLGRLPAWWIGSATSWATGPADSGA